MENLGEGCYLADDDRVYECHTEREPAGGLSCDPIYGGNDTLEQYSSPSIDIVQGARPPIDITRGPRCLYRRDELHPRRRDECKPVKLAVAVDSADASELPRNVELDISFSALEVVRSGKDRIASTFDICDGAPIELSRSTGFPAVDQKLFVWLHEHPHTVAAGNCVHVSITLSGFDCYAASSRT